MKTFIIAEAGVNHNGSLELALRLIEAAAEAGADAVKFQTFKAEKVVSRFAPKAGYQIQNAADAQETQLDMVSKLELDAAAHRQMFSYCREKDIEFMSTPDDLDSLNLLVGLGVSRLKISSGEITNAPLLLKIAQKGLPIIMSTGMATLGEIETALGVLAWGYMHQDGRPSLDNFKRALGDPKARRILKERVTLLHCTTEYPAPVEDVNLRAMPTMAAAFGLPVGYSDHTLGIAVPLAAVACGATVIEKHFTLDRDLPGPDHRASLEPGELREMIRGIRQVEAALGSARKFPAPSELKNLDIVRRSLVAAQSIRQGERFSEDNLTCKRPGTGVSPMHYWDWLGKEAEEDFGEDEVIS